MSIEVPLTEVAKNLGIAALKQSHRIATAESCTGGLIAATCTAIAGSSNWFECGLVTYSLQAKTSLLNVNTDTLKQYGAVSEPVARDMALGALQRSQASLSVSVSGIAGPDGGDINCPVGTVWFAWACRNHSGGFELLQTSRHQCEGNREAIRQNAVRVALNGLLTIIKDC